MAEHPSAKVPDLTDLRRSCSSHKRNSPRWPMFRNLRLSAIERGDRELNPAVLATVCAAGNFTDILPASADRSSCSPSKKPRVQA